jgi:hypothetical protein
MSSVRPEDGLPVRRVITADSFRALKLKLKGGKPPPVVVVPPVQAPQQTLPPKVPELPADPMPAVATVEALPPQQSAPLAESTVAPILDPLEPILLPAPEPLEVEPEPSRAESEPPQAEIVAEPATPHPVLPEAPAEPPEAQAAEEQARDTASSAPPPAPAPRDEPSVVSVPVKPGSRGFIERRVLERPLPEAPEAGERAHALLDIMAIPTAGSLPQERALANDTLLRLIPRMPLKSLRHLAERVCLMEVPSQMLVRRLINDPRIEVSGPLLENAMTVDDSDLIAVCSSGNPAKLKLMARRRLISPALSEALIQSNDVETLLNLVRNQGASFSIEAMWRLTRFAAAHPVLQAPLVTRQDTPSPIAFQLFWRLPSELRRYVLSRFLTDSETISKILIMNAENEGMERKFADLSLLSRLETASAEEQGAIYAELVHVSKEAGARIAEDQGGEALTVALKAAGLTRAQFAGVVDKRHDAEALKAIFDTLSFNKARVLLTYWDWAARRTGPYARIATA